MQGLRLTGHPGGDYWMGLSQSTYLVCKFKESGNSVTAKIVAAEREILLQARPVHTGDRTAA